MSEATSRLGWLRRRGYFGKFVLSFVGLVVLVLVLNGGLETWFMYRETTQLVVKSEGEKAEAIARRVEQFVLETERQISWATRASTTTIEQRRADYELLLQQVPAIERAIYLDSTGREQVRLTRREFVANSNLDYSGDPRFRELQGHAGWRSPVYFNGREPFIAIAAAHSGSAAGSTVAELNLKFLSNYLDRGQIGTDTEAYIIDQTGRLLAHSQSTQDLGTNYAKLPQVAATLADTGQVPLIGSDPDGVSVLNAATPVRGLNWHVFVEQPVSAALRPVYSLVFRTAWLLVLGIGFAILAGMLLAQRLVTPIKALQTGARQLEASNFGHRIEVNSKDEIGELATQFNRMADELQGSYGRLEQKVEERTRDLAKSNSELRVLEEIGRAVASSLDTKAVLATIVSRAVELSHADAGAIYGYDARSGTFELAESQGLSDDLRRAVAAGRVRLDERAVGVRVRREAIAVDDISANPAFPHQAQLLAAGLKSSLIVPLVGQDTVGALVLFRREVGGLPAAGFMQTFADQCVLALNNAQLFREVEQKGRELAIASEHKSQFLANMSHELRTPLNAVLGYAELLADGLYGDMPHKAIEVLERIQHNGKHLLGLINDVLDISKIEAGQLTLALEDYSLETMVQQVASATESLARSKGIELKTEIPSGLPLGKGDERRLTQVLLNLVSNAIKFTDSGSVEIRVDMERDQFHIGVKDTGPGIASEDHEKIFGEFQQVDNSSTRKKGGTGLGLSISRKLISLHGGRIDLSSAIGVGSTFSIVVPVRVNQQSQAA
jgi:signal transduction histidine kinase